ncbi:PKD domain-containing protein [Kineococcus rubinsiae]|uniref:PKD domain-containing protein n=1 Tax=Kineococcus rubinsiae TaxID=2609562 RepID=UPI001430EF03|nr:PKD domain-containing protein [Kineococcus rubinsiae]
MTIFVFSLLLLPQPMQASAKPPPQIRGEIGQGDVAVGGRLHVDQRRTNRSVPASAGQVKPVLAPVLDIRRTPACSQNDPRRNTGASDNSCGAAATCPAGQVMLTTWTSPAGTNQWARGASRCTSLNEAGAAAAVVLPTVTIEDVRRIGLPPGVVSLQPDSGRVAINLPVNLVATAGQVTRTVDILGFPVTIRATPVSYRWDTGDGAVVGPTADPGAPWPALTVTHTYTRPGDYAITLTTTYTAEYSVADLGFQPIAGTVGIASAGDPVTALAGTTVLTS